MISLDLSMVNFYYIILFYFQTDVIDKNISEYSGCDYYKSLLEYMEKNNLGKVEFSVFQCKSKSNQPAYYANIKVSIYI